MRRSLLPGMRYPRSAPESNHLLTVRGATLQILATSPVVRTSFSFVVLIAVFLPIPQNPADQNRAAGYFNIDPGAATFRWAGTVAPIRRKLLESRALSDAIVARLARWEGLSGHVNDSSPRRRRRGIRIVGVRICL